MNTIKDFKALLVEFELNSRLSYKLGIPHLAHPLHSPNQRLHEFLGLAGH